MAEKDQPMSQISIYQIESILMNNQNLSERVLDMAEKDQVEENGKGGDVVDGNSQGGKKGKKGPDLLLPQI